MGVDANGEPEVTNDPVWVSDPDRGSCLYFDGGSPAGDDGDYLPIPALNLNSNS
jgi:hypothetical protein